MAFGEAGVRVSNRQDRCTRARSCLGIEPTDKPLVAAVNGFAMGLGWTSSWTCDIRAAAAGVEFGMK